MTRNYRGADFSDLGWTPIRADKSENLLLTADLPRLQARALYLHRNNSVASAFSRSFTDFIAGTGLTAVGPEMGTQIFREWAKSACISGTQDLDSIYAQIVKQQVEVGDCLVLIVNDSSAFGLQTRVQIVSSTRLKNPENTPQGGTWRGLRFWHGVGFTASGKEAGYYYKDEDANGGVFVACEDPKTGRPLAVLMRRPNSQAPLQSRGLPIITPIMQEISDIANLWDACLKRAHKDAAISVILETDRPSDTYAGVGAVDEDGNAIIDPFGSGVTLLSDAVPDGIMTVPRGTKVQNVTPSGNTDLDVLFERSVRFACAAVGAPVEVVFKDFSRTNFASGKLSTEGFYRYADAWNRGNSFAFARIYKAVMMEAYLMGMLSIEEATQVPSWIGSPNYSEVDAVKTANAAKTNLETGLTTMTSELAKRGIDLVAHLETRANEIAVIQKVAEKYNLKPSDLMGNYANESQAEEPKDPQENDTEEPKGAQNDE
jgi:capsid protein